MMPNAPHFRRPAALILAAFIGGCASLPPPLQESDKTLVVTEKRFELLDRSIHGNLFLEWHVGERWDLSQPQVFEYIARDGGEELAKRAEKIKWGRAMAILIAVAGAPFAAMENPSRSGAGLATVLAGGMALITIDLGWTTRLVKDFNAHLLNFFAADKEGKSP